jgi:hypothetical protein
LLSLLFTLAAVAFVAGGEASSAANSSHSRNPCHPHRRIVQIPASFSSKKLVGLKIKGHLTVDETPLFTFIRQNAACVAEFRTSVISGKTAAILPLLKGVTAAQESYLAQQLPHLGFETVHVTG